MAQPKRACFAVVLRLEGSDTARLALINSQDFHLGALRSNTAFTAFRRASRYLSPIPLADVEDSAKSFTVTTNLLSADNNYEVTFDYAPDQLSRNRVSVLIGRNGSGKTQLLLNIIKGLRDLTKPASQQTVKFEPSPAFSRVLLFSSVASDPYPRDIAPWRGIDYHYFSMIAHQIDERDSLTTALIDCMRDDFRIQFFPADEFQPRGRMILLEKALEPLGIWSSIHLQLKQQDGAPDLGPLRQWNHRLYFPLPRWRSLNEQRQLLLVQMLDWTKSPVMFGLGNEPRNLSSGEISMLRFAAQAAGTIERGCIMLFDEPETHLHPNFISDFMEVLHGLVTVTYSVAIIATHSAYIVREVPRQRVRIFSVTAREARIDTPRIQTFGASVDNISQFVFGDTNVSHKYQSILQDWTATLPPDITIDSVVSQYGGQMNSETLSFVAQLLRDRTP